MVERNVAGARFGPSMTVRWNDVRVVPAGGDDPQLPVLFARNGERNRVRDENRGDRELLSLGVSRMIEAPRFNPRYM